jgi:hypothetical protein
MKTEKSKITLKTVRNLKAGEIVCILADVVAGPHKGAAEGMAASLPPAPA